MDDLWFVIGFVVLPIYLILMPVFVLAAYQRNAKNRRQTERLEQTVAQLHAELRRVSALVAPSVPHSSPGDAAQGEAMTAAKDIAPPVPEAVKPLPVDAPASGGEEAPQPAATLLTPADDGSAAIAARSGVLSALAGWLWRGNPLAKIGILLLFFGLAYLMKYTIERDRVTIEWRLGIAALIGGGLLAFGWCLRRKQRLYALILQGGAVGALYITVFGAFRLYLLLPHMLAFTLLLAICAASVGLAVLQRSLSLAMLASAGGYLAPILLSVGDGGHIVLFSYYLLLSLGILAISARQSWRELNLLGMMFTFGVAFLWGAEHYRQEFYLSSQLFLIINILIFGVGALLFSLRHQPKGKQIVDGILLFAPPLVGFGLQYLIVRQWHYGPALSALGFGLFYLLLGWRGRSGNPRLGLFALVLGGCFLTLSVPLAFSAEWTSLTWLLEGLCVLWAGLYQQQRRMGWSGAAIMLLGALSAVHALLFNTLSTASFLFIAGILALSALGASLCWRRYPQVETHWRGFSRGFFILGMASWMGWLFYLTDHALSRYIERFLDDNAILMDWERHWLLFPPLALLGVALSALIWQSVGRRFDWPALRNGGGLLWGMMLAALAALAESPQFPSLRGVEQFAALASWLASFAIAYWLLYRNEAALPQRWTQGFHLSLFWMLVGFVYLLASHYLYPLIPAAVEEGEPVLTMTLISAIVVALASPARHRGWPLTAWGALYSRTGLAPLAAILFAVAGAANLLDGQTTLQAGRAFYMPLLNPLEGGMALSMAALILWYRRVRSTFGPTRALRGQCRLALWLLGFWLLNGLLLRALAWYTPIPWTSASLWDSRVAQTAFALVWTLTALIGMVWSTRRQRRGGWLIGAALLCVTILKLFLVDSAGGGGLARAVAFIGVAILMLIVGYFAPLPPKRRQTE